MPIMFVIGSLQLGGAQGQVVRLIEGLDRQRFTPHLALFETGHDPVRRLRDLGVHLHTIEMGPSLAHPKSVRSLLRFASVLKRERVQIVHAWLYAAIVCGVLAARRAGILRIVASQRNINFLGSLKERVVHRLLYRYVTVVVGNSKCVIKETKQRLGVPDERLRLIYNGVDVRRFRPGAETMGGKELRRRLGIGPTACVAVHVARLAAVKDHRLALEALSRLTSGGGPEVHYVWVGDGPEGPRLEADVKARDLGKRVHLLGDQFDPRSAMAASDLVLLTSQREGFSNVILEGMAMARPVIATAVGGNCESVVHEETGVLVPAGDVRSLVTALERLARDPGLRERLGRAGRKRVEADFSLDAMIVAYERLYESL